MHGQNKLRPRESSPLLQVQDIWPTIQGEGPFSGMPAIFVRLTGCNLACTFCDTKWDDDNDPRMTADAIYSRIHEINYKEKHVTAKPEITDYWFEHKLVVLTGGEPARQDLTELIKMLVEGGTDSYNVQIETAGTYWQDIFAHPKVTIVCSPKTKHVHPKIMEHCKHWKYVIQAGYINIYDGLPAGCTQNVTLDMVKKFIAPDLHDLAEQEFKDRAPEQGPGLYTMVTGNSRFGAPARPPDRKDITVWLSPCNEGNPERNRLNMVAVGKLCMKFGYRAQVQLHNFLELP